MNKKTNLPKKLTKNDTAYILPDKRTSIMHLLSFSSDVHIPGNTSIIICGYFGLFLFNDTNEFFLDFWFY